MHKTKTSFALGITTPSPDNKMRLVAGLNSSAKINPFCQAMSKRKENICADCYSLDMEDRYPALEKVLEKNTEILSSTNLNWIQCREIGNVLISIIDRQSKRLKITVNQYLVRFHGFGELINDLHCINFFNIAYHNRDRIKFTLWSKRYDIVDRVIDYQGKPANLILIYSAFKKDSPECPPSNFDKSFNVYTKQPAKIALNCSGKCIDCKLCYSDNSIQFVHELIKSEQRKVAA